MFSWVKASKQNRGRLLVSLHLIFQAQVPVDIHLSAFKTTWCFKEFQKGILRKVIRQNSGLLVAVWKEAGLWDPSLLGGKSCLVPSAGMFCSTIPRGRSSGGKECEQVRSP